ncbi:hypothetical protein DL96DRAFT_1687161 [Flagelloscypha sp. PMI_526]|nr:hypothetical protein DL96DRAFT_1687161 [Flagelloscypha sp. PMI_526]
MTDAEPVFPPEIERQIFLFCASSNHRTILSLIAVAHRVKEWDMGSTPLCALVESKHANFLAQHVEHFILGSSVSHFNHARIAALLPLHRDNPTVTHFYSNWGVLLSLEMLIPSQLPNLSHITGQWPNESFPLQYMIEDVNVVACMIEWRQIQRFVLCVDHGPSYSICKEGAESIWNHPKVTRLESNWHAMSLEGNWIGENGTLDFWNAAERVGYVPGKCERV